MRRHAQGLQSRAHAKLSLSALVMRQHALSKKWGYIRYVKDTAAALIAAQATSSLQSLAVFLSSALRLAAPALIVFTVVVVVVCLCATQSQNLSAAVAVNVNVAVAALVAPLSISFASGCCFCCNSPRTSPSPSTVGQHTLLWLLLLLLLLLMDGRNEDSLLTQLQLFSLLNFAMFALASTFTPWSERCPLEQRIAVCWQHLCCCLHCCYCFIMYESCTERLRSCLLSLLLLSPAAKLSLSAHNSLSCSHLHTHSLTHTQTQALTDSDRGRAEAATATEA